MTLTEGRRHAYQVLPTMTVATMKMTAAAMEVAVSVEVATPTEGEAYGWPIPIVVRIGIVVGISVVAVTAEGPAAMPMAAMPPTPPSAAVVDLLDVRSLRLRQPGKTADGCCGCWSRQQRSAEHERCWRQPLQDL
jgi:hypothetical protein